VHAGQNSADSGDGELPTSAHAGDCNSSHGRVP
jgi:hypothetical protein